MGKKTLKAEEAQEKAEERKLPYPKAVFFIITNEFCERFCYYGMRTVLSLYLTEYLLYSESDATIIYHTFIMLAYFFPIFGAMIADGFLGKYRTILYISMFYALGNIILSMAAITPLGLPHREFSLLGLFFIALGTGGIKPCVPSLGGDQFALPQQERLLAQFFSIFFFSVNLGSLLSTIITPILRENVHCFGEDSCFPFAFGLPSVLMISAIITISLAKPFIKIIPPTGNLLYKVAKCVSYSVKMKMASKAGDVTHWLDYSKEKYGEKLVDDLKNTLNLLFMFLPTPIFWALIDQIGSTWTFQARRMNGDIGFYTILPDQMQLLHALAYLVWIPISEYVLYPIYDRLKILRTTLQRITCGGVITALGFISSAFVSLALESTYPVLPSAGNGQIRIYNTLPCGIDVSTNLTSSGRFFLAQGEYYKSIDLKILRNVTYSYSLESSCANFSGDFMAFESKSVGYYFDSYSGAKMIEDDVTKQLKGLPKVRTLINSFGGNIYNVTYINSKGSEVIVTNSSDINLYSIAPGTYRIKVGNYEHEYKFNLGGVYAVLEIPDPLTDFDAYVIEVTPPNSVHMFWLLPQYILLTLGELMFSIPGMEFCYSQAPISMKSLVASCWLLTTAVGNLIVILIQTASLFELTSHNSFLYAALMLLAMLVFGGMAVKYKYVEMEHTTEVGETKRSNHSS